MSHNDCYLCPILTAVGKCWQIPTVNIHSVLPGASQRNPCEQTDVQKKKTERRVYWQTSRSQYSLFAVSVWTHLKTQRYCCVRCNMVAKYRILRTALLWVITQRVVVISYRRFGTTYRSHLQGPIFGFLNPEDGRDSLSRNVGKKLPLLAA